MYLYFSMIHNLYTTTLMNSSNVQTDEILFEGILSELQEDRN